MRINHNIPALRTLHQMNRTNSTIDKTMQRLSSGLRINSAADDAAGLAIAQKMDTQVRGLKQANRNSMDGISLIQTAEGALNEVHNMLQRIRELSIQASNGTLTPEDRKAITDEVAQLKDEIDRISEHIEYNERKLLNGEIDRRAFSTNVAAGKVISMSDGVDAKDYKFEVKEAASQTCVVGGVVTSMFDGGKVKEDVSGFLNINGEQVEIKAGDSEQDVFAKIRALCDTIGIDVAVDGGGIYKADSTLVMINREYGPKDIEIKGEGAILAGLGLADPLPGAQKTMGQDIKLKTPPFTTDSTAGSFPPGTTYKTKGNIITFEANNGFKLVVEGGKAIIDPQTGYYDIDVDDTELIGDVTLTLLETGPLDLQIGANEGQMMQLRIQNMSTAALGLENMNLNTAAKSQEAITLVDAAIAQVSSTRSKLGAYQNRLEHTVANLDVAAENMTASMSRIQDADMAAEMAEFTKDNILAQAGNAMLAQANQRPQQILQLLQR